MPAKLVVLGLLMERPMHGYEIKCLIENKISNVVDISFSSVYAAIQTFEKNGYIAEKTTLQEGNRPAKTIYEITPKGRERFMQLLEEDVMKLSKPKDPYYIYIPFMKHLSPEKIRKSLEKRKTHFQECFQCLKIEEKKNKDKFIKYMVKRLEIAYQKEIRWIDQMMKAIQ